MINKLWVNFKCPYCNTLNAIQYDCNMGATCMCCGKYIDKYVLKAIIRTGM